jgi:hypothetical protein
MPVLVAFGIITLSKTKLWIHWRANLVSGMGATTLNLKSMCESPSLHCGASLALISALYVTAQNVEDGKAAALILPMVRFRNQ